MRILEGKQFYQSVQEGCSPLLIHLKYGKNAETQTTPKRSILGIRIIKMYSSFSYNYIHLTVGKPQTEQNITSSRIAAKFNAASTSNQAFESISKKICNETRYRSKKTPREIEEEIFSV